MRILLVRPPRIQQAITLAELMFAEPLGLEMLYGQLKKDHQVEIFDMMIERQGLESKIEAYAPDLLGITSLCIDVDKVLDLAKEAKQAKGDILTFVGGTQALLNPRAFVHEAMDYIFEYTNKENIAAFMEALQKGREVKVSGILSKKEDYQPIAAYGAKKRNEYLLPDRTSTAKYRQAYSYFGYKPAAIAEFGTGCEKVCNFCLRWRIEGVKEELINLEVARQDLKNIQEPTVMYFDNDFFSSEGKIKAFLQMARELGIKKNYIVYGSVDGILKYKTLISEMRVLGLKAVLVGYETFRDEELENYKKKSTVKDNAEAAKILKELKIDTWASFMAHPDWDKEDFKSFRAYVKTLAPEIATVNPLTPFPGLPIYEEYKDRLLFQEDAYEKWSFGQVMIRPSKITLRQYYYELVKTNLYINLVVNQKTEMIRQYGLKNLSKLAWGGSKTILKYVKLMLQ